jgi:hypothetical protein
MNYINRIRKNLRKEINYQKSQSNFSNNNIVSVCSVELDDLLSYITLLELQVKKSDD